MRPQKKVSRNITAPTHREMRAARNRARLARLGLPAPMFWATKVDRADMKDMGTRARKMNSFSAMPTPAEAMTPRALTILVMMRKDRLVRKSWRAMGEPTFKISPAARPPLRQGAGMEKGRGLRRM